MLQGTVKAPRIFFVMFHARPRAGGKGHPMSSYAGAFVNCWIRASSQVRARLIARREIRPEWEIVKLLEANEVNVAEVEGEQLERVEEAMARGCSFIIYAYREEEDDLAH